MVLFLMVMVGIEHTLQLHLDLVSLVLEEVLFLTVLQVLKVGQVMVVLEHLSGVLNSIRVLLILTPQ